MEDVLRLVGRVDVDHLLGLHVAILVVDRGIDDAITNGLGDDELGIDLRVQVQLLANVTKANSRVREIDLSQACLDDISTQSNNQSYH